MSKSFAACVTCALFSLMAVAPARATLITYTFSGTVTFIAGGGSQMFPAANVGDPLAFAVTLDDGLTDLNSLPSNGAYGDLFYSPPGQPAGPAFTSVLSSLLTIGSQSHALTWGGGTVGPQQQLQVLDGTDIFYGDGRHVVAEGLEFTAQPSTGRDASNNYYADAEFWQESPAGTALTGAPGILPSDALPTSLDTSGTFAGNQFDYFFENPGDPNTGSYVIGSINGLTITVAPEPTSAALLAVIGGIVATRARRRR